MSRARIAVLASGGGRSLENLCEHAARGAPPVEIALVLSDRPGAGALERAARRGLTAEVIDAKACRDTADFSERVIARVERSGAELIVMAGFLRKLLLPPRWSARALNIHPSLLPAFGGRGFYGERVHRAVLASGVRESGCTVHYVDDEYDHGPILLQRRVPVLPADTVESLAARVFAEECLALPEAVALHFARPAPVAGAGTERRGATTGSDRGAPAP